MFNGSLMRWLGRSPAHPSARSARSGPNSTQFVASHSGSTPAAAHAERKELLKAAMREMLQRNGIPESWLSADLLRTSSAKREQGIHVRLLVKHWEPRLMLHGVALEQDFYQRLLALDPSAPDWLMGFSWQFTLGDLAPCPPLPRPGSWTAPPPTREEAPVDAPPTTTAGDIIEGPVLIPRPQDDVRADLERLLALRDDDARRNHANGTDSFAPTRPVSL